MNITMKLGSEIEDGDCLLISIGTTCPFESPLQPMVVVDHYTYPSNQGQVAVHCKKKRNGEATLSTSAHLLWKGEYYFVVPKEQKEQKG